MGTHRSRLLACRLAASHGLQLRSRLRLLSPLRRHRPTLVLTALDRLQLRCRLRLLGLHLSHLGPLAVAALDRLQLRRRPGFLGSGRGLLGCLSGRRLSSRRLSGSSCSRGFNERRRRLERRLESRHLPFELKFLLRRLGEFQIKLRGLQLVDQLRCIRRSLLGLGRPSPWTYGAQGSDLLACRLAASHGLQLRSRLRLLSPLRRHRPTLVLTALDRLQLRCRLRLLGLHLSHLGPLAVAALDRLKLRRGFDLLLICLHGRLGCYRSHLCCCHNSRFRLLLFGSHSSIRRSNGRCGSTIGCAIGFRTAQGSSHRSRLFSGRPSTPDRLQSRRRHGLLFNSGCGLGCSLSRRHGRVCCVRCRVCHVLRFLRSLFLSTTQLVRLAARRLAASPGLQPGRSSRLFGCARCRIDRRLGLGHRLIRRGVCGGQSNLVGWTAWPLRRRRWWSLQYLAKLLEVEYATSVPVPAVKEGVHLLDGHVEPDGRHSLAKLLLAHLAVAVGIPLAEKVEHLARILAKRRRDL